MSVMEIRIDENLKNDAEAVAQSLGLSLTQAMDLFLREMVKKQALPFQREDNSSDGACNRKDLRNIISQVENGCPLVYHNIIEV